jgi:hypothetical protein
MLAGTAACQTCSQNPAAKMGHIHRATDTYIKSAVEHDVKYGGAYQGKPIDATKWGKQIWELAGDR